MSSPPFPMMDDPKKPTPKKKKKTSSKVKYKKAPQAPKRFKSAFIFFSTAKHREIREQLGDEASSKKTTSVAKMVSEAWRNISAEDREVWVDMARKDKDRYEVEKSMYTGPWKVPATKRQRKNPDAPKRPMSAFLAFSNDKRKLVKEQYPNKSNAHLSKILAKMWEETPEEERQPYINEEYRLRQIYLVEIAEWREQEAKDKESKRQQREDRASAIAAERRERGEWSSSYATAGRGGMGTNDEPYSLQSAASAASHLPADPQHAAVNPDDVAGLYPSAESSYYQAGGSQTPYLDAYYQQLSQASAAMPYFSYPYASAAHSYPSYQYAEGNLTDQAGLAAASYASADGAYPSYGGYTNDLSQQEQQYLYQTGFGGRASQYGQLQTSHNLAEPELSPARGGGGYYDNYPEDLQQDEN